MANAVHLNCICLHSAFDSIFGSFSVHPISWMTNDKFRFGQTQFSLLTTFLSVLLGRGQKEPKILWKTTLYNKICLCSQNSRSPQFTCKNNDSCTVTLRTRRRCQSCRYKLCLQAGMKPELVLSEDQKLIRFRKLLHRKKMGLVPTPKRKDPPARYQLHPQFLMFTLPSKSSRELWPIFHLSNFAKGKVTIKGCQLKSG